MSIKLRHSFVLIGATTRTILRNCYCSYSSQILWQFELVVEIRKNFNTRIKKNGDEKIQFTNENITENEGRERESLEEQSFACQIIN